MQYKTVRQTLGDMLRGHEAGTNPKGGGGHVAGTACAGAHKVDGGIKFTEITEGAWDLAPMTHFYCFISIL